MGKIFGKFNKSDFKLKTGIFNREGNPDFIKSTDIVRQKGGIDRPLVIIVLLLLAIGWIMVFSASYVYSYESRGDSFYYIKRETIFSVTGVILMFVITYVLDYRLLNKLAPIFYIVSIILLLAVFVVGIGKGLARRWINLGLFTFQPSEIAKFAVIVGIAFLYAKYQYKATDKLNPRRSFKYGILYPSVLIGIVCVLVALEKHISGTIIIFLIGLMMIFTVTVNLKFLAAILGIGGVAVSGIIAFSAYGGTRIDAWLHPENYRLKEAYQSIQGTIAIGSGGIFGVGLGNSTQKHLYVSEPMNDFIFSIICEELGMVGALAIIALFILFIWRGITIAKKAPDTFSSLVALGITLHIGLQALLNIMVVTGLAPNTGISLPLISYGGTALYLELSEIGVLLAISRYSYARGDIIKKE